jgi:hypothetical protein
VEFERSRVDGVPVFWTESGDEMLAGLVFRVGRADESLARGGITHLVEHLALYPLGVDGEAGGRRPGMTGPLFIERYGADTYGLPSYPEYGINAVQAPGLKAWADRYFTRGNAALWVAGGPPPGGLVLDLPDGPAVPAPQPGGKPPPTPAHANAPVPGDQPANARGGLAAHGAGALVDNRRRPGHGRPGRAGHRGTPDGTATAALLVFGLILGVSAALFARARLLIRAAQQNPRKY